MRLCLFASLWLSPLQLVVEHVRPDIQKTKTNRARTDKILINVQDAHTYIDKEASRFQFAVLETTYSIFVGMKDIQSPN